MGKRYLLLSLLAVAYLCSDSGRSVTQLLFNANAAADPASLLWQAAQQGSAEARSRLVDFAVDNNRDYWLQKAVNEGSAEAAWALYQTSDDQLKQHYLKLAAQGDVAEAQYALAMSSDTQHARETWLLRAAQNGLVDAKVAVANWYLLNQQNDLASPWIAESAAYDDVLALLYGKQLWQAGDHTTGLKWITQSADNGHLPAKRLLDVMTSYTETSPSQAPGVTWPAHCVQRVSIVATSLSSIERADYFYNEFVDDSRLQSLPICMAKPIWVEPTEISCSHRWQGQHRLGCDIRPTSDIVKQQDATHLAIVAEQGKANVFNGVMFLDVGDTYSVFVHELAHWAGFVDEYPLSEGLAKLHCNTTTAPNMIFEGKLTYAPLSTVAEWQDAEGAMVISPTRTCRNVGKIAYKPSSRMTFMEFHDSNYIPELYLSMWKLRLSNPALHYPVYVNLHEAFREHRDDTEADYWLARYQVFRTTGR